MSLSKNVKILLPTLLVIGGLTGVIVWQYSLEQMQFPFAFILMLGLVPTILVHLDYLIYEKGRQLSIDKFSRKVTYLVNGKEEVFSFQEILNIEKYISIWHFLPVSNYFFYVINRNNGTQIKITCLAAENLEIGEKDVIKRNTNLPFVNNPI